MPCCLYKGPLKRDFLNIYLTRFLESVNLEIQKLWGSFSFSKCLKFKLDLKNASKNWEKVFSFWDNCIWIDIVKLSLLRTGYFSLAANVLTSSTKIWHVNKRDFFQLNWIGSDKWIWSKCSEAVSKVPGNLYRRLVQGSSELWLFTHLSDYAFGVRNFENGKSMRVIFFFQNV